MIPDLVLLQSLAAHLMGYDCLGNVLPKEPNQLCLAEPFFDSSTHGATCARDVLHDRAALPVFPGSTPRLEEVLHLTAGA